jgi:hypothetical protein
VVLRTLTEDEQKARVHALADARLREAEERKIAEEEAHVRLAREASERTERDAAEARKRGEEDRRRHDDETKRKAELEAKKRFGGEDAATAAARPAARPVLEADEEEAPRTTRRGGVIRPAVAATPVRPTVVDAESLASVRFDAFDVVLLLNVRALGAKARELHDFVEKGGGLFVSLGGQVDPDRYGEELGDRTMGVAAGYLVWAGLVPEQPKAIYLLEHITSRQLGPQGRDLVAVAGKLPRPS